VRKPERKRPLGKSEHRFENSKIDLIETRLEAVNWIYLAQDREKGRALVNTVTNLLVPKKCGEFLGQPVNSSISRRTLLPGISHTEVTLL
jgi:hypothetical protein